jgi:plasmid stabilization system protein ParE
MKVLISSSAFSDLEDIKEYYAEQDVPDIGVNFISEIFVHIETLNDHPKIGRSVPEFNDDSIREIIHPPFRVVYLLEEKVIHIVRVWRSERLLKLPENEI